MSIVTVRLLFEGRGVEKKFAGRIYIFEDKEKASPCQPTPIVFFAEDFPGAGNLCSIESRSLCRAALSSREKIGIFAADRLRLRFENKIIRQGSIFFEPQDIVFFIEPQHKKTHRFPPPDSFLMRSFWVLCPLKPSPRRVYVLDIFLADFLNGHVALPGRSIHPPP